MANNPATRFGPVAEQDFDNAPDWAKEKLAAWLDALPSLSDDDFSWESAKAIHDSALADSFRGNWNHDHCRATAAHTEAQRRHIAAGHLHACTGDTLYSRAFRRVWREQGHNPNAYPLRPCDCGKEG